MSWDEVYDELKHHVTVNGEDLNPFDMSEGAKNAEGHEKDSEYPSDADSQGREKSWDARELAGWNILVKARSKRSSASAPNPFDDSYTHHGSECVKKQKELIRYYTTHIDSSGNSHGGFSQEEIKVAQGIPGIPEAPAVFAEGKEDNGIKKDVGPQENAVAIGENGQPKEIARGVHIAVLVEEGEEARLACHYCRGSETEGESKIEELMVAARIGDRKVGV
ncbi:hypothetical protein PoB_005563600 [Plakobranchus ocellatus]|uniref:Uncharacterized protein n=1 Tax=Plakobranchus ocellatus TaxID=259542 RepID=A0AAV4CCQ4_9GAST|nr:hypothetical protein PoB_005563600 [Plakobranchus ocellatus]